MLLRDAIFIHCRCAFLASGLTTVAVTLVGAVVFLLFAVTGLMMDP